MRLFSWLLPWGERKRSRPASPRSRRPLLESLERRDVPASFTVAAGDVTGLIAAINAANVAGGTNVITLTPGVYDLTAAQATLFGPTGLPAITNSLTIVGNGSTIQRDPSAATPAFRLITVLSAGALTLDGVVLSGGLAQGGNGGSGFDESGGGAGLGGAVFNAGALAVVDSVLTGNRAVGGSGGVRSAANFGDAGGGGLGGNGGDGAPTGESGGGGNQGDGGNGSGATGGAGGDLTGGKGGDAGSPGSDGGIGGGGGGGAQGLNAGGAGGFGGGAGGGRPNPTSGAGGFGGGGARFGMAGFGGGFDPAGAGGGGAGMGGAVFNFAGSVSIVDSTLTGDVAQGGSGFAGGSGYGGAVFNLNGSLTVVNATLAFNSVVAGAGPGLAGQADGGAIYNLAHPATGANDAPSATAAGVVLENGILSNSSGGTDLVNNQLPGAAAATVTASTPNVVTTRTTLGVATTNATGIMAVDPLLDPTLRDNGGPTRTLALTPLSPAIDAGSNPLAAAAGLTTDQRGLPRVAFGGKGKVVDLGAFEVQPPEPPKPPQQPPRQFAVGAGPGVNGPHVKVFDQTGALTASFFAYGPDYAGGVRVAVGDVTGDGITDVVTGAGPGAVGGHVKVFDGATGAEVMSFLAFPGFAGVFVAAGDVNHDGFDDVVVGAGPGAEGGHVKVFSGKDGSTLASFLAFPGYAGGVEVAAGDVDRDGSAAVVVSAASPLGGHVEVFSGQAFSLIRSFFVYSGYAGPVSVAVGDVDGDGFGEIVTGAEGSGGGHVKAFGGRDGSLLLSFLAYPGFSGGVSVGAGDLDGDGRADLVAAAGPLGDSHVEVFSASLSVLESFFAFPGFEGAVGA